MNFCNRKSIQMNIEDINNILNKIGKMVNLRKPEILPFNNGYNNIRELDNNQYLLTFRTYGAKFILFLTMTNGNKGDDTFQITVCIPFV